VAQAARYHRKGMPEPGPLAPLFAADDAERLDRLAVLLRLAEDLERSRDQLVHETRLTLAKDGADGGSKDGADGGCEVQLRLVADGEAAVPRWAAGRDRTVCPCLRVQPGGALIGGASSWQCFDPARRPG
jgi:exopolyphosphatase/guanosine-5'-triphosphate,3'-diphosphate pyrophosphatase